MKPLIEILGYSYAANSEKNLPAKIILWRNHDLYIENQIIIANILQIIQIITGCSYEVRYGYKSFVSSNFYFMQLSLRNRY